MRADDTAVVLLGAARSGTKFLRSVIAAPDGFCATPFDCNHIWRLGNARAVHDELDPQSISERDARDIRAALWKLACPSPSERVGKVLVEKTVSNALRPVFVERVLPGARYVVLLRDGRDVVESTFRMWMSPPDGPGLRRKLAALPARALPYALWYGANMVAGRLRGRSVGIWGVRYRGIQRDLQNLTLPEVCAYQWRHCVQRSLEFASGLPPDRCVIVRYESLIADPNALTPVCRMLNLDASASARVHHALSSGIQRQPSRWDTTFDASTRERILDIIGRLQAQLGYPVA
ncbi:sulfotransferase family protein [Sinimarinibacterium thermocellulolyticum]|uniref:Sulfotransferase n=1 Tax=Sinimarinibacterium thermocellulolyticum TaxID=3170016 RepID=A0ABV2A5H6_9GAMM